MFKSKIVRFLSAVPSQLTAHLLQLVYGKICASLISPTIPIAYSTDGSDDLCLDVDDNIFGLPSGYTFNDANVENDQLISTIKVCIFLYICIYTYTTT